MARLPYPRAAVSCILQSTQRRYLLIKRGKPPGVGEWSVPGGKLELGETSIAGALREIYEETGLPACALSMHPRPVTVSDVCTHDASGSLEYHYVIAQCFAWVAPEYEAQIIPGDDASDARWFAAEEIRAMPVCDAPYAVAAPSSTLSTLALTVTLCRSPMLLAGRSHLWRSAGDHWSDRVGQVDAPGRPPCAAATTSRGFGDQLVDRSGSPWYWTTMASPPSFEARGSVRIQRAGSGVRRGGYGTDVRRTNTRATWGGTRGTDATSAHSHRPIVCDPCRYIS
jgi:8-oxo-dGTP diphosphatase